MTPPQEGLTAQEALTQLAFLWQQRNQTPWKAVDLRDPNDAHLALSGDWLPQIAAHPTLQDFEFQGHLILNFRGGYAVAVAMTVLFNHGCFVFDPHTDPGAMVWRADSWPIMAHSPMQSYLARPGHEGFLDVEVTALVPERDWSAELPPRNAALLDA